MQIKKINLPLDEKTIRSLKCGDIVSVSGTIYTARDAAHKRLCQSIEKGEALPLNLKDCAIYYCGPAPKRDGEIIGSCGPTTSARMDSYTPLLLENGVKVMIGKGKRSQGVIDKMIQTCAVYLVAIGGAGALIKESVCACETIAYEDLDCEAIYKLEIKDLELLVGIDCYGKTILN